MVLDELYRKLGHNEYAVGGGVGARDWDWGTAPLHELDSYIQFFYSVNVPPSEKTRGGHLDVLTRSPLTPDPITNESSKSLPMSIPAGYAIEELAMRLPDELVLFEKARYNNGR